MRRVDIAVYVEFQRRIDADHPQPADDFRMVADLLRPEHQVLLVLVEVGKDPVSARSRKGDGGSGGEGKLSRIEKIESAVLQHFTIHAQVMERPIGKTGQHGVGNCADTSLQRLQGQVQPAFFDLVLEETDEVRGDRAGVGILRLDG